MIMWRSEAGWLKSPCTSNIFTIKNINYLLICLWVSFMCIQVIHEHTLSKKKIWKMVWLLSLCSKATMAVSPPTLFGVRITGWPVHGVATSHSTVISEIRLILNSTQILTRNTHDQACITTDAKHLQTAVLMVKIELNDIWVQKEVFNCK